MTAATNARAAETAAQEAKQAAEAVNQHFWDDTRGAHVTEAEKDDYLDEPSGFQNLMTSLGNIFTKAVNGVERILRSDTASGMVVYDGECAPDAQDLEDHVVGAFTKDGAQIGRKGNAHVEMDFNSFKMVDKDSNEFFVADDLRDETGVATVTEIFKGDGRTKEFLTSLLPTEVLSATDSSHPSATYTVSDHIITFTYSPDNGATVTIVYKTMSRDAKAYTIGTRLTGSSVGPMSVAAGEDVEASGIGSHAEGRGTKATAMSAHAEGTGTLASDEDSHAEGSFTKAQALASHAEGISTWADANFAHAEGSNTTANGEAAHAEGVQSAAMGTASHAEGNGTTAYGPASHAEGLDTRANSANQHVEGKYNEIDNNGTYAHIIGNGTSDNNRSNAYTVDWDGNVEAAGTITGASVGDANGTLQQLRDSVSPIGSTKSAKMFHWNGGMEIDLRDNNGNGVTLTFGGSGIKLFKVVNNVTTLFHSANWDA